MKKKKKNQIVFHKKNRSTTLLDVQETYES